MKYLIKEHWWDISKDFNTEEILYLLVDRPDRIVDNVFFWTNKNNKRYRVCNLPRVG